jgi:Ca-activated chloride channel family protein
MRFHDPQFLLLLLLLIPLLLRQRGQERRTPAFRLAYGVGEEALPDTFRARCARYLPYLRLLLLALAMLALARPQASEREVAVRSEGGDLVVALDLSTSMLAEDLQASEPRENRLAMAKAVLAGFLRGRQSDRIGLVAFAARAYPAAPLTLDHEWLQAVVARLQTGAIEDGTAVGDAILAALNRLRDRPARSQAVILITDGRSNTGVVTPQLAAAAAQTLGVRIHTIGIGSRGAAVIPIADPLGGTLYHRVAADLDETVLREIAATTHGRYFRADDQGMLAQVFREIDRLEKRLIEEKAFFTYRELYPILLLSGLAVMVAELLLRSTWLRRLP